MWIVSSGSLLLTRVSDLDFSWEVARHRHPTDLWPEESMTLLRAQRYLFWHLACGPHIVCQPPYASVPTTSTLWLPRKCSGRKKGGGRWDSPKQRVKRWLFARWTWPRCPQTEVQLSQPLQPGELWGSWAWLTRDYSDPGNQREETENLAPFSAGSWLILLFLCL